MSPVGKPAEWYIDQAGLKGMRASDAMLAYEHANWIVKLGNARAEDVKALINIIQDRVFERVHISLEREIIFVPED